LEIRQFCDDLRSEAISRVHMMEKRARSYSYRAEPYVPEPYEPMEKDEYVPVEVLPEPRGVTAPGSIPIRFCLFFFFYASSCIMHHIIHAFIK
jgi:hypothetical protein